MAWRIAVTIPEACDLPSRTSAPLPIASRLPCVIRQVRSLTADANRFGWRCFLGQEPGTDAVPGCAVPARVQSVAGLPPAFIGVGALDIFVDENIAYARRLIEAGVPTELLVVPGAFHGFDMLAKGSAASRRFAAAKIDALRRAFQTSAMNPHRQ